MFDLKALRCPGFAIFNIEDRELHEAGEPIDMLGDKSSLGRFV